MDISLLWIPATLAAASAQTARNATQRRLIETLGTVGATQVRFLYGLPFAALFLAIVLALSGERPPRPDAGFLAFVVLGATTQILATAMMLAAMRERSFAVVTATTKTEPVHIALFGLAATGFRGAILSLDSGSFVLRATTTLVCGLALQTAILVVWLLAFNRPALVGSLREWRSSL